MIENIGQMHAYWELALKRGGGNNHEFTRDQVEFLHFSLATTTSST